MQKCETDFVLVSFSRRKQSGWGNQENKTMKTIPFVIIRAISDKADGSAEIDYTEFEHDAAIRCAAITRYMITH